MSFILHQLISFQTYNSERRRRRLDGGSVVGESCGAAEAAWRRGGGAAALRPKLARPDNQATRGRGGAGALQRFRRFTQLQIPTTTGLVSPVPPVSHPRSRIHSIMSGSVRPRSLGIRQTARPSDRNQRQQIGATGEDRGTEGEAGRGGHVHGFTAGRSDRGGVGEQVGLIMPIHSFPASIQPGIAIALPAPVFLPSPFSLFLSVPPLFHTDPIELRRKY